MCQPINQQRHFSTMHQESKPYNVHAYLNISLGKVRWAEGKIPRCLARWNFLHRVPERRDTELHYRLQMVTLLIYYRAASGFTTRPATVSTLRRRRPPPPAFLRPGKAKNCGKPPPKPIEGGGRARRPYGDRLRRFETSTRKFYLTWATKRTFFEHS